MLYKLLMDFLISTISTLNNVDFAVSITDQDNSYRLFWWQSRNLEFHTYQYLSAAVDFYILITSMYFTKCNLSFVTKISAVNIKHINIKTNV
jgi:hypothetical protein